MAISGKIIRKILKIAGWITGSLLLLLVIIVLLIRLPAVQNVITQKAVGYLSGKLHTRVSIGKIYIAFPKSIHLQDLYLEDQSNDTLISVKDLNVNIALLDLLSDKITVSSLTLEGMTGKVRRLYPDTTFNYSFVLQAFSSSDTVGRKKDTTASSWKFAIGTIRLKNIHLTYSDTLAGIDARIRLGEFKTTVRNFDSDKMKIGIKEILLSNCTFNIQQTVPLITVSKQADTAVRTPSVSPEISIDKISLSSIRADYRSFADTLKAGITLQSLTFNEVGYSGDSLSAGKFILANTSLAYDKTSKPAAGKGMDFNHLLITGLGFRAGNIVASPAKVHLDLQHFAFREKSGFLLKEFTSKILYDSTQVVLAALDIQTGNSRIRSHLEAHYPSLEALKDSIEKVKVKLVLDRVTFSMTDVLYFMPSLSGDPDFGRYSRDHVDMTGKIDGTLKELVLKGFDLKAGNVTRLRMEGVVKDIMNTEKLFADVSLQEMTTSRGDIMAMVPKKLIPENIEIPEFVSIDGVFRGSLKNFITRINLSSSIGNITARMRMSPAPGKIQATYDGQINLDGFDPGQLLSQPDLGPITLSLKFNGSGLDTSTLNTSLHLKVDRAKLMGYTYHDLSVRGTLRKMSFDGEASMTDSNLYFSYKGIADLDPRHGRFNFNLYLKGADLYALKLSDKKNLLSGSVIADIQMKPDGNVLGKASLVRIMIVDEKEKVTIDSVIYSAAENKGVTNLSLRMPGLAISANGKMVMKELGVSFNHFLAQYYKFSPAPDTVRPRPQQFDYSISLTDPELFQKLIPSLNRITPFTIEGNYDSEKNLIGMKGFISQIVYGGMTVDSLSIDINTRNNSLLYDFSAATIFNNMLRMDKFDLKGRMEKDAIFFSLSSEKADSGTMIAVTGKIDHDQDAMRLVLDPPLTLANTNWNIAPRNAIIFGQKGMIINGLTLSSDQQSLAFSTKGSDKNAPLEILFRNFDIGNFSKIIEKDTELVRGVMNGRFTLISDSAATGFTSDLTIDHLRFMQFPVGDLKLQAENTTKDLYAIRLGLTGGKNDLQVSGNYSAGTQDQVDMTVDIRNLAMATLEPFTMRQVSQMSGDLKGQLKITGSTSKPALNGVLQFQKVKMRPAAIGTFLTMNNEKIAFEGNKIRLDNFTMADSLNNKAVLNGFADISDLKQIAFDITLTTRNFLALNNPAQKKETVHGTVLLDSDIHLTGSQQQPVVNMKVRLNKGTNVTFVNTSREAGMVEHEGIVVFTDSINRQHPIMTREDSAKKVKNKITEMDLKAQVEFDKDATLKMMVDPVAGDSLFVRGSGNIQFTLDPSGTMSLTGKYTIKEGGYHLTVSGLLKRDFRIREGSSIAWNGDIMDAETDITALYDVETSPLILLEDQLSGASDQQKNKYRNTLKFDVVLSMAGALLKPEIHFDIELQEKDRGAMGGAVYSKLAELREDESQLNKQVFALLTLGRFLGQDPLESGNGPITVSSAARSSASKLMTDQLNSLSAKYVKGVDLDVGVKSYEDYSSGQAQGRTQLQLGISKQMLQGRLNVRVGSNIDVEGEKATQNNLSDIAGDLSAEYKLTDDGRFRLKGFRQTEYENPIEGELVKTGIGFIYTRDFNKIREIYKKQENAVPLEDKKKKKDEIR